ncbi:hypothetical protein SCUCBS95973_007955 [Sporothrix curviconia]|uniref:Uncharacterized protein n=1 Tax=Sporothrix curviconia TaxID=1260050 RepID=A0ABP0CK40_9PEZI
MDSEASPPNVLFSSVADVFHRLASLDKHQDVLVFGDVSPDSFRTIEKERDGRGQKFGLFYQASTRSLVITVPTFPHSCMHTFMYEIVFVAMVHMNAHTGWTSVSNTTFEPGSGSSGQADSSGMPAGSRGVGDWPTLVVEAGYSQTLPSLRAKMRWWFAASNHQVKVVILVKMISSEGSLLVEKWMEAPPRSGATGTRRAISAGLMAPQPVCMQTVTITWDGPQPILQTPIQGRTASQFRVTGAPLIIGFADIYLRAPAAGESDINISLSDLQLYASRVWASVA